MRRLITPVAITTAALIAAGALGNAAADPTATPSTTTTTPPRLLTVTGDSDTTLPSNDPQALFTQAYRAQLSAALDDASATATAITAKEGVTLGAIQTVTEQSSTPVGDCEQPEFAADEASGGVALSAPKAKAKKTHKKKANKVHGHALSITTSDDDEVYPCDVTASVTVSYAIQ